MPDLNIPQQSIQTQEDEPAGSELEHIPQSTMHSTHGPVIDFVVAAACARVAFALAFSHSAARLQARRMSISCFDRHFGVMLSGFEDFGGRLRSCLRRENVW